MQTVTFTTDASFINFLSKFSVVIYCFFIFSFFLKHQKIQKHNIFMKMKQMIWQTKRHAKRTSKPRYCQRGMSCPDDFRWSPPNVSIWLIQNAASSRGGTLCAFIMVEAFCVRIFYSGLVITSSIAETNSSTEKFFRSSLNPKPFRTILPAL